MSTVETQKDDSSAREVDPFLALGADVCGRILRLLAPEDVSRLCCVDNFWAETTLNNAVWADLMQRDMPAMFGECVQQGSITSWRTCYLTSYSLSNIKHARWAKQVQPDGYYRCSPREGHALCSWRQSKVGLLFGGFSQTPDRQYVIHNDVHLLDPGSNGRAPVWMHLPVAGYAPQPRYGHTMVQCGSAWQYGLVFGGMTDSGYFGEDNLVAVLTHPDNLKDVPAIVDPVTGSVLPPATDMDEDDECDEDEYDEEIPMGEKLAWGRLHTGNSELVTGRGYHSCAVSEDGRYVYIFGGISRRQSRNDVLVLDTVTWSWDRPHTAGEPPAPRFGHSATVFDNKLWVIGGGWGYDLLRSGGDHDDVCFLDLHTLQWHRPPELQNCPSSACVGRCHASVRIANKMLFFGGSLEMSNELCWLDFKERRWGGPKVQGSLPQGRISATLNFLAGRVLMFGGWMPGCHELGDLHEVCITLTEQAARDLKLAGAKKWLVEQVDSHHDCDLPTCPCRKLLRRRVAASESAPSEADADELTAAEGRLFRSGSVSQNVLPEATSMSHAAAMAVTAGTRGALYRSQTTATAPVQRTGGPFAGVAPAPVTAAAPAPVPAAVHLMPQGSGARAPLYRAGSARHTGFRHNSLSAAYPAPASNASQGGGAGLSPGLNRSNPARVDLEGSGHSSSSTGAGEEPASRPGSISRPRTKNMLWSHDTPHAQSWQVSPFQASVSGWSVPDAGSPAPSGNSAQDPTAASQPGPLQDDSVQESGSAGMQLHPARSQGPYGGIVFADQEVTPAAPRAPLWKVRSTPSAPNVSASKPHKPVWSSSTTGVRGSYLLSSQGSAGSSVSTSPWPHSCAHFGGAYSQAGEGLQAAAAASRAPLSSRSESLRLDSLQSTHRSVRTSYDDLGLALDTFTVEEEGRHEEDSEDGTADGEAAAATEAVPLPSVWPAGVTVDIEVTAARADVHEENGSGTGAADAVTAHGQGAAGQEAVQAAAGVRLYPSKSQESQKSGVAAAQGSRMYHSKSQESQKGSLLAAAVCGKLYKAGSQESQQSGPSGAVSGRMWKSVSHESQRSDPLTAAGGRLYKSASQDSHRSGRRGTWRAGSLTAQEEDISTVLAKLASVSGCQRSGTLDAALPSGNLWRSTSAVTPQGSAGYAA